MKPYKIPESVLVVVHDPGLRILLLERADRPGFWQSVTGSLDRADEWPMAAARRELEEETGLRPEPTAWRDWHFRQQFEIFPHWRHRYAPGVTVNTEHMFSVQVPAGSTIRLAPREHLRFQWLDWRTAAEACFSWSNAAAIRKLALDRDTERSGIETDS